MSYIDMAHSHVERRVREAMGLTEVKRDPDGDIPFRYGTAACFISVDDDGQLARVWSPAVRDLRPTAAVLRELNAVSADLSFARVVLRWGCAYVEASTLIEELTARHLRQLCDEVGSSADGLGQMLAAVHGGSVFFPLGVEAV